MKPAVKHPAAAEVDRWSSRLSVTGFANEELAEDPAFVEQGETIDEADALLCLLGPHNLLKACLEFAESRPQLPNRKQIIDHCKEGIATEKALIGTSSARAIVIPEDTLAQTTTDTVVLEEEKSESENDVEVVEITEPETCPW